MQRRTMLAVDPSGPPQWPSTVAGQATEPPRTRVFVYGTLRRGCSNHGLIARSEYLGEAVTDTGYSMLHLGGFPGVVKKGNYSIYGELYEVDEATLRQLDRLEGHPSFYERRLITVLPTSQELQQKLGGGDQEQRWITAQCYLLPDIWLEQKSRGGSNLITTGDWLRRSKEASVSKNVGVEC